MLIVVLLLLQSEVSPRDAAIESERAYAALRDSRYDEAAAGFRRVLELQPGNAHLRKDLAYTLLKRGDRDGAREQFEAALHSDPADERTALEYGFVCYETRRPQAARRTFLRLKSSQDKEIRKVAEQAFENVDRPLREGIERWSEAVQRAPRQWSAHEELAQLAETRDLLDLAAEHYEHAWRLRPAQSSLLLDLARVWTELGDAKRARQTLVAAWRSGNPRVAETARELLDGEIPRDSDLALAVTTEAGGETTASPALPAREMGERSLASSYLNDAHRYFEQAHKDDPADANVIYKLGVTSNLLGRDREALNWFDQARRSTDADVRDKARSAYESLRPSFSRFSLNAWTIPFYSSRWNDVFFYGQMRGEWTRPGRALIPYVSLRFVGDSQGRAEGRGPATPLFLSENSVIAGAGLHWRLSPRLYLWGEAGESVSYLGHRQDSALMRPDYRGGVSYLHGWGRLLGSSEGGLFAETNLDGVYASRFNHDMLLYIQSRSGRTFSRSLSGWQAQAYFAWNVTLDLKGEYWGNVVEFGPGARFTSPALPKGMSFRVEMLRGAHLVNDSNPGGPRYWDLRTGMWYAFSR